MSAIPITTSVTPDDTANLAILLDESHLPFLFDPSATRRVPQELNDEPDMLRGQVDLRGAHACKIVMKTARATGHWLDITLPVDQNWHFSRTFHDLPIAVQWHDPDSSRWPILDLLPFSSARLVLCSAPMTDPDHGVALQRGANFIAKMKPKGIVAFVTHVLGASFDQDIILWGTIDLQPNAIGTRRPGFTLQANIPIENNVLQNYGITLQNVTYRLYSPPSMASLRADPGNAPVMGFTADMVIAADGQPLTIRLAALQALNAPHVLLSGNFEEFSLGTLARALGMKGTTESLTGWLPETLRTKIIEIADIVSGIELQSLSFLLDVSKPIPKIKRISATIGAPKIRWEIWEQHLSVERISIQFTIYNPPLQSAPRAPAELDYDVTVRGTVKIDEIAFDARASSRNRFRVDVSLDPFQRKRPNFVFGTLVHNTTGSKLIDDAASLTLDDINLTVAPLQFYQLRLALSNRGKPWTVKLGPTNLNINCISADLVYPHRGVLQGTLAGEIAIGDAVRFPISYDLGGGLSIQGIIPKISLGQLIDSICDGVNLKPPNLDIDLIDTLVFLRVQSRQVTVSTGVAGIGSLALDISYANERWKASFGIEIDRNFNGLSTAGQWIRSAMDILSLQNVALKYDSSGGEGAAGSLMAQAKWKLGGQSTQEQLLAKLLTYNGAPVGGDIDVTLALSTKAPSLKASISDLAIGGLKASAAVSMTFGASTPSLKLDVRAFLPIGDPNQPPELVLGAEVSPTGFNLFGGLRTDLPVDIGNGLKIVDVAGLIGVNTTGLPVVGVTGKIQKRNFMAFIALLVDTANPTKFVIAGAVRALSILDIVAAVDGPVDVAKSIGLDKIRLENYGTLSLDPEPGAAVLAALRSRNAAALSDALHSGIERKKSSGSETRLVRTSREPGSIQIMGEENDWFVSDKKGALTQYHFKYRDGEVSVGYAPQIYITPTGAEIANIRFDPGFRLAGIAKVFDWTAEADISISTERVSGVLKMDSLTILHDQLFQIRGSVRQSERPAGAEALQLPHLTQNDDKLTFSMETAGKTPHLHVSALVTILGRKTDTLANISARGLAVSVEHSLLGIWAVSVGATVGSGADLVIEVGINWDVARVVPPVRFLSDIIGLGISVRLGGKFRVTTGVDRGLTNLNLKGQFVDLGVTAAALGKSFPARFDLPPIQVLEGSNFLFELEKIYQPLIDAVGPLVRPLVEFVDGAGQALAASVEFFDSLAATTLENKDRWIAVQIRNETAFQLILNPPTIESGKYWAMPQSIPPRSAIIVTASERNNAVTGTGGHVSFKIADGDPFTPPSLAIMFSHPLIGGLKCRGRFNMDPHRLFADTDDSNRFRDIIDPLFRPESGPRVIWEINSRPGQNAVVVIRAATPSAPKFLAASPAAIWSAPSEGGLYLFDQHAGGWRCIDQINIPLLKALATCDADAMMGITVSGAPALS
jgi:hypothetical protein